VETRLVPRRGGIDQLEPRVLFRQSAWAGGKKNNLRDILPVMSALPVLRLVRPLHSARSYIPSHVSRTRTAFNRSAFAARQYSSEDKPSTSKQENGKEDKAAEDKKDGDDFETRLKAKEEELQDITVRPSFAKAMVSESQVCSLQSRLRYAQADFHNLQKISAREKEQTREYAITNFARDLLTTVDVLELALASVPASSRTPSAPDTNNTKLIELYNGVELTQKQLIQTLGKYGVKHFNPMGEKFDPNLHEALYSAPAPPGAEPGHVIDCQKLGYMMKDRVLRAAQVGVASDAGSSP
jgi:molecular chaperone GrpE